MTFRSVPLLLGLLLGCDDPKAPGKCRDLRDALCENYTEQCEESISYDDCLEVVRDAGFKCDEAWGVSDSYESCLILVSGTDDCLLDEGLPAVCDDTILTY